MMEEGKQIPQVDLNSTFSINYKLDEGYYPENRAVFKLGAGEYATF